MTRYSRNTPEMRCAYCGRKKPWDSEHFPVSIYAICRDCAVQQQWEREDAQRRHRTYLEFALIVLCLLALAVLLAACGTDRQVVVTGPPTTQPIVGLSADVSAVELSWTTSTTTTTQPQHTHTAGRVGSRARSPQPVNVGCSGWKPLIALHFPADQIDNACRIIRCESSFDPAVIGGPNRNGTYDVGLFQINDIHGHSITWRQDPNNNVAFAGQLYARSGWRPWVCARKVGLR